MASTAWLTASMVDNGLPVTVNFPLHPDWEFLALIPDGACEETPVPAVLCYLGMAAGVLGLLVLPAAYELIRSRFVLIFPALLSFIAALACVYINYKLLEENYYAAMPVVIFAFLYLLAALPKKKVIIKK